MERIKIEVKDRRGDTIFTDANIDPTSSVFELKKHLLRACEKLKKRGIGPERVRLTVGEARGLPLQDKNAALNQYIKTKEVVLFFKDLGPQVSWTTVFLVEYFGPILITLLLVIFQKEIYGKESEYTLNQKLGIFMVLLHYVKREFETVLVHRFSNDTMPFMNIFKNSTHYWLFFGVFNMYFFLHPQYTAPTWASETFFIGSTVLFCIFEFLNLQCHLVLKNLRKPGTTERGIPKGWGFSHVSCANYFWEAMAWLTFAVQSQVLGAYFFLAVSFFQMLQWALQKHNRYKKDFPKYPRGRKAMIPFII